MIIIRVDDVGRRPMDKPEFGTDSNLSYFKQWRETIGVVGLPVYYGVVPCWLNEHGWSYLKTIQPPERMAMHGWNHYYNSTVTRAQMEQGRARLGADAYIPPFNDYNEDTLKSWQLARGKHFFGGIDCPGGVLPGHVDQLLFLPAHPMLYGRARDVNRNLGSLLERVTPKVLTLHVPWDLDLNEVKSLIDDIRDRVVPIERAEQWLKEHGHDAARSRQVSRTVS